MNQCLTVIFGLPKGLLFVRKVEINLADTYLQGIRITFPINMTLLLKIITAELNQRKINITAESKHQKIHNFVETPF